MKYAIARKINTGGEVIGEPTHAQTTTRSDDAVLDAYSRAVYRSGGKSKFVCSLHSGDEPAPPKQISFPRNSETRNQFASANWLSRLVTLTDFSIQ